MNGSRALWANSARGDLGTRRTIAILKEVAAQNRQGLRLTHLAKRLGLEAPTAHRILKCLAEERVLRRDPATRSFHLGPLVFELGLVATPQLDMRELCGPVLRRLADKTGDTVFLTKRSGLDAVCLLRSEGTFPVKTFTLEAGMRRPLGIGAGSLAILSALPLDEIENVVQKNAPRLQDFEDGSTVSTLMAAVRRAQRNGYALRDLHGLWGVRTLGVAIRAGGGMACAALSLSAIRPRMTPQRVKTLVKLLKAEAAEVESKLVGVNSPD
jgi:DNA-binding IclR family transcriptional regulator